MERFLGSRPAGCVGAAGGSVEEACNTAVPQVKDSRTESFGALAGAMSNQAGRAPFDSPIM